MEVGFSRACSVELLGMVIWDQGVLFSVDQEHGALGFADGIDISEFLIDYEADKTGPAQD